MEHNNLPSPASSSPVHYHKDFVPRSTNNNTKTSTGDNISTLSQPNSDISSAADVISVDKYQRLAAEFAKLRAQFLVLKKAVIDEQAKSADLQETLKLRDQSTRKMQQETESLIFRNKQLTKRISVLQTDLDHTDAGGQKRSFLFADVAKNRSSSNVSNASSAPSVDLLDEINQELKGKVEENVCLRELVDSMNEKQNEQVQLLERKLKETENRAERSTETLNGEIRMLANSMTKMKNEKSDIESKFKDCLNQLREYTAALDNLKQEHSQLKSKASIYEKQLMAAKQHARLHQLQSPALLHPQSTPSSQAVGNESSTGPQLNGIPRSGSFSGVIRSSGSFSRGIPRSGSLSINSTGSPSLANLLSTQSQSSKDLSQLNSASNQQTSPSHSSKSYQDVAVKERIIADFATKISEVACALSTLHSNVSKKISILFALFNNNVNHFYFFDISTEATQPNDDTSSAPLKRSAYIQTILRKFSDYLKSGYDTHLVHLEEATHQFLSAKIRYYQRQQSDEAIGKQSTESTSELNLIQQEIKQLEGEIIEKFNDYINYLNKVNPYISLCLNFWCKNLREYKANNSQLIKSLGLDTSAQAKLADVEKRNELCRKQEQLAHSLTNCIQITGQICNHVKLLLSKQLLNTNYLTVFNHFLHRINALEKSFDEAKQLFTSKVVLEHDLGITVERDLLSVDDCIHSSMVFFRKSIVDLKLMLEMHYFFFVDNSTSSNAAQSASPLAISGQIPEMEEPGTEDEEEEGDEEQDESDDDNESTPVATAAEQSAKNDQSSSTVQPNQSQTAQPPAPTESTETKNRSVTSNSNEEMKQLEEQVKQYHRQLAQLKQEKEQWTIESELNQLKLEAEQRKVSELEIKVQSLVSQSVSQQQSSKQTSANSVTNQTSTTTNQQQSLNRANSNTNSLTSSSGKSLDANNAELVSISSATSLQSPTLDCFGTVKYPSINDQSSVTLSSDDILTDLANHRVGKVNSAPATNGSLAEEFEPVQAASCEYLQQMINKLVDTLQLTDSRAAAFQQEYNSIRARYLQLSKEKGDVDTRLTEQDQTLIMVQEEYQTSVENYEFQLRTMSEHLAELNEKLTAQREEIDILKYEQQQQPSGKTSSVSTTVAKTFRRGFKKS